jgi:hypothetical protein
LPKSPSLTQNKIGGHWEKLSFTIRGKNNEKMEVNDKIFGKSKALSIAI